MKTHSTSGSVLGGVLLITGCCIGAGMLGLPVISALTGFKPSISMFLISWLFMTSTALLLLEVNLWIGQEVSLISMADRTMGFVGKALAWVCFLFLFYALGVAYLSGTGELIGDFVGDFTGTRVPSWMGSLFICLLFAIFLYLGTRAVDIFNRFLMLGLLLTYVALVVIGAPHIQRNYLAHSDWKLAPYVLPVMMISFGFHNLIPSLTTYLKGDLSRLRKTIILGSSVPLVIYLVWEWLILGLIPIEGQGGFRQALTQGDMATQALRAASGSPWIIEIAQYFAFFAITTSFLGNSLSFVDFLADGLKIKKTPNGKILLCLLVILPPFLLALAYPKIFLSALNYAGAFGAVTLFGILPACMVWVGRYRLKLWQTELVPGGKIVIIMIILFALGVMGLQLSEFFLGN